MPGLGFAGPQACSSVSASPSVKRPPRALRVCLSSRGQRGGRRGQMGPLEGVVGAGCPAAAPHTCQWPETRPGESGPWCWLLGAVPVVIAGPPACWMFGAKAYALGTPAQVPWGRVLQCGASQTRVCFRVSTPYHHPGAGGLRYGEPQWRSTCDLLRVLCFQTLLPTPQGLQTLAWDTDTASTAS